MRTRCGCNPCPAQIRRTEDGLIPTALAIAGAFQWVAACGGAWLVSATTRSTVAAGNAGMRDGRVLSRVNPATPSCIKRSCQRHTTVLPLPTARMIAMVPAPSALKSTIRARQTCFCGLLRSRMIDCKRVRSAGVTSMVIPLRMPHNGTNHPREKLLFGLFRQLQSTSGGQQRAGAVPSLKLGPLPSRVSPTATRRTKLLDSIDVSTIVGMRPAGALSPIAGNLFRVSAAD